MATWTVQISISNLAAQTVNIVATAVDGDGTYAIPRENVYIGTAEAKTAALDDIWALYAARKTREANINTTIGTLAANAKTNLDARTL